MAQPVLVHAVALVCGAREAGGAQAKAHLPAFLSEHLDTPESDVCLAWLATGSAEHQQPVRVQMQICGTDEDRARRVHKRLPAFLAEHLGNPNVAPSLALLPRCPAMSSRPLPP